MREFNTSIINKWSAVVLIAVIIVTLSVSCASTKPVTAQQRADLLALKNTLNSSDFTIIAETAYPLGTTAYNNVATQLLTSVGNSQSRVNLLDRSDAITKTADSLNGRLSFYGERRIIGNYNATDTGIIFNQINTPAAFQLKENQRSIVWEFTANQDTENYEINIEIFNDKAATINVWSNKRTSMRYDARVVVE